MGTTRRQAERIGFRAPFLIVNSKAYLTGAAVRELAVLTDELAAAFGIDTLFTAQHADLRLVAEATTHLTVTAQHMDPLRPGRGMGHVLPESLAEAGARAVVLNHAEHPLTVADLDASIGRAREAGLLSIVCADSDAQCRAVACLGPDIMICEPTAQIASGAMTDTAYAVRTTALVKDIDPSILVIQAAGVSGPADAARALASGADGTGGTTFIVEASDRRAVLSSLYVAVREHRDQRCG
ncbi:triose-phosphate isomerase [Propionicicella superfundia]|uniref:triose-phosphate isomerase n=1 Tax=Propionicicella superfundia TaxID=348582 RepID=UPI0004116A7F|nr:triose-phosphate isomerase [Propionicicella superfundia]